MDTQKGGMRADERHASPEQIKADINRTRSQMDETIDAMTNRLNPGSVIESVRQSIGSMFKRKSGRGKSDRGKPDRGKAGPDTSGEPSMTDTASEKGKAMADTMKNTVKDNPIPIALIGAGLAWLVMAQTETGKRLQQRTRDGYERARERGQDAMDRVRDRMSRMKKRGEEAAQTFPGEYGEEGFGEEYRASAEEFSQQAGGMADEARQRSREAMENARAGAQRAKDQARQQYEDAKDRSQELFSDYPLVFGLGALALGLGLGMALPHTRREDEMLGDQAQRLKEQARRTVRDTGQTIARRGREVAQATTDAATEEMRREGLGGESLRQKAQRIAERTTETATETATHGRHEGR